MAKAKASASSQKVSFGKRKSGPSSGKKSYGPKEQKPKKEKSKAQLYYDKIISTKNELERLNDSLTGERDIEIKNKFRQIETLMKTLQSLLGKRDDVNALK